MAMQQHLQLSMWRGAWVKGAYVSSIGAGSKHGAVRREGHA